MEKNHLLSPKINVNQELVTSLFNIKTNASHEDYIAEIEKIRGVPDDDFNQIMCDLLLEFFRNLYS